MPAPWQLLASEPVLTSPWLSVHRERLRTGRGHVIDPFWRTEAKSWVCVVALTPDGQAVLVEQYRRGCDRIVRELPAGDLDPAETAAACAVRELAEETGYQAVSEPVALGVLWPEPARCSAQAHGFLVRVGQRPAHQELDAAEDIATVLVPWERLRADPAGCGVVHAVHHAFIAKTAP
jgi:8-oxo-dGTP pyrophosphatase MutT (NUDIX family)